MTSEPVGRERSLHRVAIEWLPAIVVASLIAVALPEVLESRGEVGFFSALSGFCSQPLFLVVMIPVWVAIACLSAWLTPKLGIGRSGDHVRRG